MTAREFERKSATIVGVRIQAGIAFEAGRERWQQMCLSSAVSRDSESHAIPLPSRAHCRSLAAPDCYERRQQRTVHSENHLR